MMFISSNNIWIHLSLKSIKFINNKLSYTFKKLLLNLNIQEFYGFFSDK